MPPAEVLQLLRTLTLAQIREQLEKEYAEGNETYHHFVRFVLSAKEQHVST